MTEFAMTDASDAPEMRMPAPVTEIVTRRRIACDGDDTAGLGHPRVWLAIPLETGFVDCGYCDKRFVFDATNAHEDH